MARWFPQLGASTRSGVTLSGTWMVLVGGFLALAFVWVSLAYRFSTVAAPRTVLLTLFVAFGHLVVSLLGFRRGWLSLVAGLFVVILGIAVAVLVRVFLLVGAELVAGFLLLLGRRALLANSEGR